MTHWLHMVVGRGRRLAAFAADELPPSARTRLEAKLKRCHACRREIESYRLLSDALRRSERAALTPEEAEAFWPGVETRIRQGVVAPSRLARPGLKELFWDHPRLSLASAAAAVVLVMGLTVGQLGLWGPRAVPNGVEVLSVEAGDDAPVMVFQSPGGALKVIWVFEKPSS